MSANVDSNGELISIMDDKEEDDNVQKPPPSSSPFIQNNVQDDYDNDGGIVYNELINDATHLLPPKIVMNDETILPNSNSNNNHNHQNIESGTKLLLIGNDDDDNNNNTATSNTTTTTTTVDNTDCSQDNDDLIKPTKQSATLSTVCTDNMIVSGGLQSTHCQNENEFCLNRKFTKLSNTNNLRMPSINVGGSETVMLSKHVYQWSVSDVAIWLKLNNFASYVELFCDQHQIDGHVLANLSAEELRNEPLKLKVFGDIKRLCLAFEHIRLYYLEENNKKDSILVKNKVKNGNNRMHLETTNANGKSNIGNTYGGGSHNNGLILSLTNLNRSQANVLSQQHHHLQQSYPNSSIVNKKDQKTYLNYSPLTMNTMNKNGPKHGNQSGMYNGNVPLQGSFVYNMNQTVRNQMFRHRVGKKYLQRNRRNSFKHKTIKNGNINRSSQYWQSNRIMDESTDDDHNHSLDDDEFDDICDMDNGVDDDDDGDDNVEEDVDMDEHEEEEQTNYQMSNGVTNRESVAWMSRPVNGYSVQKRNEYSKHNKSCSSSLSSSSYDSDSLSSGKSSLTENNYVADKNFYTLNSHNSKVHACIIPTVTSGSTLANLIADTHSTATTNRLNGPSLHSNQAAYLQDNYSTGLKSSQQRNNGHNGYGNQSIGKRHHNRHHRHHHHHHHKDELKPEAWKAIAAMLYFFASTWITAIVMVVVHDRVPDMDTYPPLPDILLDNLPLIPWAFSMCEFCGLVLFIIWSLILIFHKHRFILLRRMFSLFGSVFLIRCVTMLITSLSVPGRHLECKARPYGSWFERLQQAYLIWQGGGMSIQGVRTCGDYMFSGHTVVLTLLNFFITEYTSHKLYLVHTLSWVLNLFGIFFILAAHEHYSIDVFIAFYISTRMFLYYHTLANNRALYQRDRHRTRIWFPLFYFFESGVSGIVPNQYEIPFRKLKNRLVQYLCACVYQIGFLRTLFFDGGDEQDQHIHHQPPSSSSSSSVLSEKSSTVSNAKVKVH